jgi:hypothetical protein
VKDEPKICGGKFGMQRGFDYQKASPEALKQMLDLTNFVNGCGLEESLLRLVFVRASLKNGC